MISDDELKKIIKDSSCIFNSLFDECNHQLQVEERTEEEKARFWYSVGTVIKIIKER